jgi:hypothetical protein
MKERRTNLRVPFVAQAEIIEAGANIGLAVRVSDISKDGCYVDLRSPLPKGTTVRISIQTATGTCEADAVVAFTHPHLGMGLVFKNMEPRSRAELQKWLTSLSSEPEEPKG